MAALTLALAERGLTPEQRTARQALRAEWTASGGYRGQTLGQVLAAGALLHGDAQLVFSTTGGRTVVTLAEVHERGLRIGS